MVNALHGASTNVIACIPSTRLGAYMQISADDEESGSLNADPMRCSITIPGRDFNMLKQGQVAQVTGVSTTLIFLYDVFTPSIPEPWKEIGVSCVILVLHLDLSHTVGLELAYLVSGCPKRAPKNGRFPAYKIRSTSPRHPSSSSARRLVSCGLALTTAASMPSQRK